MRNQTEKKHNPKPYQNDESELEAKWFDIEKEYREKYPAITDGDVEYCDGEFEWMTRCIAYRTRRSYNQVINEIRNWGT